MALPEGVTDKTRMVSQDQYAELMRAAFNHVCDPNDWKAPVDAIVPWGLANIYIDAIRFMTATIPTAERCADVTGNPSFRLQSVGYRMGPAGDH